MKPKVMVIGLDGATLTLMKPWAEQGILPNFAELMKRGCSGILKSTTPPYTPTAWSSFYTGVNPGKHGIYSFTRLNPATGKRELISSRVIGAKKLWQILNEHGLRTGLINLPLTYPPERLDGYMITGMLTPENSDNFTYPASLMNELGSLKEPYIVDVPVVPAVDLRNTDVLKHLHAALRGRLAACLHMLDNHPCDLLMAVFVTPDRIQHVFWKYVDENSNLFDTPKAEKFRAEIMECYRALDEALGDIIAVAESGCQIYIVSDHGFCELHSEFFLNNWLASEGFFSLGASSKFMLGPGYRWLRTNKLVRFLLSTSGGKVRERGLKKVVDWENTMAYVREQGLFINLKGREEQGSVSVGSEYERIRSQIAERLRRITDPYTGNMLVDSVLLKEEIYKGPYINMAPDIVPVMDKYHCYIHDGVLRGKFLDDCSDKPFGAHHPHGVFLACGPNIVKNSTIDGASIIDVTPTIIHALGLPVPESMDGRVLEDIFERVFLDRNPVKSTAAEEKQGEVEEEVYSQTEADEIQEQLRGMGYLS